MNHVYRLTWNESLQQYVAAPETARGRHKQGGKAKHKLNGKLMATAVAAALIGATSGVSALPLGGQVSSGTGSVTSGGATLTVNQSSPKLALNWQSFSIAGNETVNFVQPNASAIALNRVLGSDPSAIYGKLNANGQVFLLNPNGILFGQSAEVNVGGLVASTLNLSDADFAAGKRTFGCNSGGSNGAGVGNLGRITADGGYIAFLGAKVSNQGTMQARLGTVALAAGNQTTLDFAGDQLIKVQVERGALHALAENGQLIQADGGAVILTAKAADHLIAAVVNNSGLIQARTLENHAGVISLLGDMQSGLVNVRGTLDASAPNGGNGGFIETSAAQVKVANDAKVTTASSSGPAGAWLIDPVDFTIAATGGDITGATLSTNLGAGNVSILSSSGTTGTAGNVNVNDAVTWSANQLTLNAQNNININANLNGSGTASLALQYGQGAIAAGNTSTYSLNNGAQVNLSAGNNFSTKLGSNGGTVNYTVITSLGAAGSTTKTDLQGMNGNLAGNYVLGANIDASASSAWNGNAGFVPIGNYNAEFDGILDGLGHTITGLTINTPASNGVGLFGQVGTIGRTQNVGLVDGSVSGAYSVGALVGSNSGTIRNSYATGRVSGNGGISGGLVGDNSGVISNSYATGSVTGGTVGSEDVGGLAGWNYGTISNSYAMGSVSGSFYVGGLVGFIENGTISNSYSTGRVSGNGANSGGLTGWNYGTISNSFWNTTTSGYPTSFGGTGLTSTQMMVLSSFSGWSIGATGGSAGVWRIYQGHTAPLLTSFLTPLTLSSAPDVTATYNGAVQLGGTTSTTGVLGSAATGTNVGVYNGYYSTQQGYNIIGGNLAISAAAIGLSTIGMSGTRAYDGTTNVEANIFTLSGLVGDQTLILAGVGTIPRKNIGIYNLNLGTLALGDGTNGGLASNYTLAGGTDKVNITPKTITASAAAANKVYNGTVKDTIKLASAGVIAGDVVKFTDTSATFADKNVGNDIIVTVSGIKDSGKDAGNYILSNTTATTTANITPKTITVSAIGVNKAYDGTVNDTVILGSTGVIAGDVVSFADASASFANNAVGNGKSVSIKGITDSGADAVNYKLSKTTATAKANITP